jgi:hypothetical protein
MRESSRFASDAFHYKNCRSSFNCISFLTSLQLVKHLKMSFKLIVVCATLAAVSSARLDGDQLSRQIHQQQELIQQQNDRIRDQQRLEDQQRQVQIRDLENQQRRQEQMIRDQQQQRLEYIRSNEHRFISTPSQIVPGTLQIVNIPSSRRNFQYFDDSNYNFAYAVSDLTTGDIKSQQEVRRGDQVQGQYTMMDADGYQRIVDYRADDRNGFDAEVRREPAFVAAQVYPTQYQPIAVQQPTIFSSTSVSRRNDGQRSQYSSATASNF